MSLRFHTESPDQTLALGRRFSTCLAAGDVVLLSGRLGAGKTLFVQGVAEGLGISDRITSPSFMISRTYRDGFLALTHADVYRLGSVAEFDDLELVDGAADGVLFIEWGDTIEEARRNLVEAVEGFFEMASASEIRRRLKTETYVMSIMPSLPPGRTLEVVG